MVSFEKLWPQLTQLYLLELFLIAPCSYIIKNAKPSLSNCLTAMLLSKYDSVYDSTAKISLLLSNVSLGSPETEAKEGPWSDKNV